MNRESSAAMALGLDLATATVEELSEQFPELGLFCAEDVVDWRTKNGRFPDESTLVDTLGLGPSVAAQLMAYMASHAPRRFAPGSHALRVATAPDDDLKEPASAHNPTRPPSGVFPSVQPASLRSSGSSRGTLGTAPPSGSLRLSRVPASAPGSARPTPSSSPRASLRPPPSVHWSVLPPPLPLSLLEQAGAEAAAEDVGQYAVSVPPEYPGPPAEGSVVPPPLDRVARESLAFRDSEAQGTSEGPGAVPESLPSAETESTETMLELPPLPFPSFESIEETAEPPVTHEEAGSEATHDPKPDAHAPKPKEPTSRRWPPLYMMILSGVLSANIGLGIGLLQTRSEARRAVAPVAGKVAELHEEHVQLRTELDEAKSKIDDTRNKLDETRTKINDTRTKLDEHETSLVTATTGLHELAEHQKATDREGHERDVRHARAIGVLNVRLGQVEKSENDGRYSILEAMKVIDLLGGKRADQTKESVKIGGPPPTPSSAKHSSEANAESAHVLTPPAPARKPSPPIHDAKVPTPKIVATPSKASPEPAAESPDAPRVEPEPHVEAYEAPFPPRSEMEPAGKAHP